MNETVSDPTAAPPATAADPPDLDAIEADFDRVERALQELADGTYADPADAAPTDGSDERGESGAGADSGETAS